MIFDLSSVNLAQVIVTGIVTMLGAFFGSYIMWKLIGPAVVKRGIGLELGPAMLNWLFEPSIKTGEKVVEKKEKADGTVVEKEIDEIVAPAEELARRMGRIVYFLTLSRLGVDTHKKNVLIGDVQAALANPDNPLAQYVGGINPRIIERALKDGDYIPILLQLLLTSPQAQNFVAGLTKKIKSSPAQSTPASGGVSGSSAWLNR